MENVQGAEMEPANETLERAYNLSVWLANESSSLLEVYIDLQGFSEPPLGLPSAQLELPAPPADDWDQARRLRHHHTDCRLLAALLRRVLDEQQELNETGHHFHHQLQFAITGLEGLVANLGLILSSLGFPVEGEGAEEEVDSEGHQPPSSSSGFAHWEAKVKGYHVIAHYNDWIGRTVEELERLKDNLKPEA
ncbi:cardiotrophin-2-like [Heterodontus francisci]|uniref:cardiotrophin-2-like n=1 Tax=Heterodontus francisci TaxID=7792 RepID=UPI00355BE21E